MYPALNDDLVAALKSYSTVRRTGGNISVPVAAIIDAMGKQAPSTISEADGAIANAAELWGWTPKPQWWRRLFLRRKDDFSLLSRNPSIAYLFVFHGNGFVRQAALERLSGPAPNAFLVSALAWRLNDWVPQVRASALISASRCFPRTSGNLIADFLFDTSRLRNSWGRWSVREKEVLENAMNREDVKEHIVTKLLDSREGPLPSFLADLMRYEWIDQYLPIIASDARVPGVRAIALKSLISGSARYSDGSHWRWIDKPMGIQKREPKVVARAISMKSDPKTLIQEAVIDKSALVRRVALSGLIELGLYNSIDDKVLQRCTADASFSVRSRAEFIWKKKIAAN